MPKRWTGPTSAQQREQASIAQRLGEIGFVLPGSVAQRSYRCGKPICRCHADPPQLHGPYIQWSRQVDGRTAHINLTPDQIADYQPYFDQAKQLRELVTDLETLTLTAIQRDPRFKR